jgi:protein disulfide-isomerase
MMDVKGGAMTCGRYLGALTLCGFLWGLGKAAEKPLYDEKADAREQIAQALSQAAKSGKNLVLIFGANW